MRMIKLPSVHSILIFLVEGQANAGYLNVTHA